MQVVDLLSGTATQGAGNDYTYVSPTVVTFAAGSVNGATQSVNLNPLDDPLVEGTETVNLQLQNVTGPATILATDEDHRVDITDDEAAVTAIWKPTAAIFLSLWSVEIWPLPKALKSM